MKRFRILGVALVALFAFGVLTASSAFAEAPTFLLALWLVGGAAVTTDLAVESTGELLLEDTKAVLGIKAMVLCSGILDGLVSPESLNYVSEVLSLTGLLVNTEKLVEAGLLCVNQENCAEPLVWALHLPWQTEVELMEVGGQVFFANLLLNGGNGKPGWEVWCMGPNLTDECEAEEAVSELKLEGTTLLGIFADAFTELAGLSLATCSLGGALTGVVEGEGVIKLEGNVEELVASSETSSA